ncbi:hypothetical protein DSM110093_03121 [Sulfitobacter sp. DSM 110093]|uniref:GntR family transcriptional regulator n=1 Tax=Sulfitobacter sp. DSM 110093 TaxID=2883127 RepID=UPI001FADC245|nr:FCD domain-containing protein [Sulfitobacter sp. DSM 110093]UOA33296.1 hypothetical protein DSM110093_03121 [Sulfitobacter sp. DSM 110093]
MAIQKRDAATNGTTGLQGSSEAASTVQTRIRDDIIEGQLEPGSKLKIDVLQERYGTSATPLREALVFLSATGLVDRIERRGFRVAKVSSDDYMQIFEARCLLEARALRDSIELGDARWEERIVLSLFHLSRESELEAETGSGLSDSWEAKHREFHEALISGCPSKYILRFCSQLYDDSNRYRYIARLSARARIGAYEEHKKIGDSVLRRDVDASVELLVDHLRRTADFLKDSLADIPNFDGQHR